MECRMRTRVRAMVEQLAREHQQELAAAGTLVDLEELTAEIGDEFGRQLCENELTGPGRDGRPSGAVRVPGMWVAVSARGAGAGGASRASRRSRL